LLMPARRNRWRAFEPPFRDVAGDQLAAVLHRRGEGQGLAAGAGAEIDDSHAGTGVGEERGELRASSCTSTRPALNAAVPASGARI